MSTVSTALTSIKKIEQESPQERPNRKILSTARLNLDVLIEDFSRISRKDIVDLITELLKGNQYKAFLKIKTIAENTKEDHYIFLLGICYQHGLGCDIDIKMMHNYNKMLAQKEYPLALFALGNSYFDGDFGLDDKAKGMELMDASLKQEEFFSPYYMHGYNYLFEEEIQDVTKGLQLLLKAHEKGISHAVSLILSHFFSKCTDDINYVLKDDERKLLAELINSLISKANSGNEDAQFLLASLMLKGMFVQQDLQGAFNLLRINNHPDGLSILANIYVEGLVGVANIDNKKAFETFQRVLENSSDEDHIQAFLKFANENKKNFKEEFEAMFQKFHKEVKEKSDPIDVFNLALCYQYGLGCEVNLNKSRKYFERAATLGYTDAQLRLAKLLSSSEIGEVNYSLALKYLNDAADDDNNAKGIRNEIQDILKPLKKSVLDFFVQNKLEPADALSDLVVDYAYDVDVLKKQGANHIQGFFTMYQPVFTTDFDEADAKKIGLEIMDFMA